MKKGFHFKSVYAKFAAVFLGIWWVFNGVTFGIIMQIINDGATRDVDSLTGIIFLNNAAIGTIVILLALRSIVKPIKKLANASREVAAGKFDVAVEVRNQDEIGRLAGEFNAMVQEIGSGTEFTVELPLKRR
jgi:HAMP domain-containing protein